MKQNTRHATHETQVQREAEKKTYAHDKDSYYGNRHTDKECARGRPRFFVIVFVSFFLFLLLL